MKNVLLIVDDEYEICRMLEKTLKNFFAKIYISSNAAEAEAVLDEHGVTHIIVDMYLGAGEQLGHELIQAWRVRYPNIRFAVLFTGSSVDNKLDYEGVDGFFIKPSGLADLIRKVQESLHQ